MEHNPIKSQISRYLFFSLGATLSIASLALLFAHSYFSQKLLEQEIQQRANTISRGIEFATEGLIESQQPVLLKRVVQNYATLPGVIQIEIISPTGQILTSSPNDRRAKMLWTTKRIKMESQIQESRQKGLKLNMPIEQNGHSVFVQILPFNNSLFHEKRFFGQILIVLDIEPIHKENMLNFFWTLGLSFAGVLFVLGGTIFVLRKRVLLPLQSIQSAIAENSGTSPLNISLVYDDEIGFLAKTLQQKFNETQTLTAELEQRVKERTKELQNAQEFLQKLLDYLPVALFVKDLAPEKFGQIILWNHTCEKIFNLTAEEILGKNVHEIYSKEYAELYESQDREAANSKKIIEIAEEHIESPGQGTIYIHTIKVPLFDRNGEPEYLLCICEDITVRKQAENDLQMLNQDLELRVEERTQAVRESEARYRNLLDQASDAILIADMEGNLVETNQKAIQLLGYSRNEIVQLKFAEIYSPEEIFVAQAAFQEIITHGHGKILDTLMIGKNNRIIPTDITGSLIEYSETRYIQIIVRDISDRKKAELEIQNALIKERELNELKTQFIDVASHEFRTPLTVILGNTEFIIKYYQKLSEEKRFDNLNKVLKSALRLKEMIEDVLVLSRLTSDKITLELQSLNIESFCHEVVEDVLSNSENKNQIMISLVDEFGLGKQINGDPKILYHILSNLLNNAVKYSKENSPIECVIELSQSEIIFKISDRGIGIPQKDLVNICESFHRASNVENIPGTGLGLNIVKRYIELHRGTLEIESEVNLGSTFTVRLPRQMQKKSDPH
ncbi:MAG: PAS domain S-box protein [Snowella sp.]|nr:PAS domain S-box protein [Snowella sp.]